MLLKQNRLVVHSVDVMIVRSSLLEKIHTFKKSCRNRRMFERNTLKKLVPLTHIGKRWTYEPRKNSQNTVIEPRHSIPLTETLHFCISTLLISIMTFIIYRVHHYNTAHNTTQNSNSTTNFQPYIFFFFLHTFLHQFIVTLYGRRDGRYTR